ncbi:MAG TPA: hypothetical protein VMR97_05890 [Acidimicrobiales bacterium]|nr:hypothetical protein [Acidimicrobiales bacterium]
MTHQSAYLLALCLTVVIEAPVYACLLRVMQSTPMPQGLAAGAGVNLVSHPIGFLVLFPLLERPMGPFPALAIVELVVVLVEAGLLFAVQRREALPICGISYVANVASFSLGVLLLR